jgi:NAD(P)-dependent dehydrogenase (short-subunit alcohol dehydrogenase family)
VLREETLKISVEGRVALVTGASRGIGQAIAIGLAEAGAEVAVNYREDAKGAEETVAAIKKLGRKAVAYRASVGNYEEDREMVAAIARDFGAINILINNAGVGTGGKSVAEGDPAELEHVLRVNALAPYFLANLVIPHMRRQKRGDIVMISSVATLKLLPNTASYAMSKAAAEALSGVLSKEERQHGIRCNVVGPGLTDTAMARGVVSRLFGADDIRQLDVKQPFGHVCSPQEVAAAVVYLVSDANPYANGQRIYIDGGGY